MDNIGKNRGLSTKEGADDENPRWLQPIIERLLASTADINEFERSLINRVAESLKDRPPDEIAWMAAFGIHRGLMFKAALAGLLQASKRLPVRKPRQPCSRI